MLATSSSSRRCGPWRRSWARASRSSPIALGAGRGEDIVPLIGARRRDRLAESLAALELRLDERELGRIEAAVPEGAAAGERYPEPQMAHLDSER